MRLRIWGWNRGRLAADSTETGPWEREGHEASVTMHNEVSARRYVPECFLVYALCFFSDKMSASFSFIAGKEKGAEIQAHFCGVGMKDSRRGPIPGVFPLGRRLTSGPPAVV